MCCYSLIGWMKLNNLLGEYVSMEFIFMFLLSSLALFNLCN